MGDHRVNLEFSVTGMDGKVARLEMWINWSEDVPLRIADAIDKKARSVGLRSDWYGYFQPQEDK